MYHTILPTTPPLRDQHVISCHINTPRARRHEHRGRGPSRSWSHTSDSEQGMTFTVFWENTYELFKTQPEVPRARSTASLRLRWSVFQRFVQKNQRTVRMKFAMD